LDIAGDHLSAPLGESQANGAAKTLRGTGHQYPAT
jgi:hypothetical protein